MEDKLLVAWAQVSLEVCKVTLVVQLEKPLKDNPGKSKQNLFFGS